MRGLALFVITVAVVTAGVWLARRVNHPEDAATHRGEGPPDTPSERTHGGDDRPAGADAEVGPDPLEGERP